MKCEEYKYVPPEYIKSGAAIRMQKLKNRSHIDYINYIKYLIRDAKIRFPEYTENYSDIEILADIQHKGGASCLVDFSNNFLISLWFATQTNNDDNNFGYLFCYDINSEMIEKTIYLFCHIVVVKVESKIYYMLQQKVQDIAKKNLIDSGYGNHLS